MEKEQRMSSSEILDAYWLNYTRQDGSFQRALFEFVALSAVE